MAILLPQLTLSPPHCVHVSILYIYISTAAHKQAHLYYLSIFLTYALIYSICFSLSDFTLYDRF